MRVAVIGATGAVGREMWRGLEASPWPIAGVVPYTSSRSAGKRLGFRGTDVECRDLERTGVEPVDLALFSAGSATARTWAPRFRDAGAVVIDNSSAFRGDPDVPLIVPEVNGDRLPLETGLVANPNCSTIQMVVALAPLHREWALRSVRVATYQAVSGAGARAVEEFRAGARAVLEGRTPPAEVFPYPIAFDVLPHVGPFDAEGVSLEEAKVRDETRRILGLPELPVSASCVRVPVERGHSEAVWASFAGIPRPERARELLAEAGLILLDDPAAAAYPRATLAAGRPEVFAGRVRRDEADPHGLCLWVVADNLLKGAATNALQIAGLFVARGRWGAVV